MRRSMDSDVRRALPSFNYASERSRNPFVRVIVTCAEHVSDFKLRITFSDKKIVVVDFYARFLKLNGYCSKVPVPG